VEECKPLLPGLHVPDADLHAGARLRGRAAQVDPVKPNLKPPGTQRLKLKCDILLSTSAFGFTMRHYYVVDTIALRASIRVRRCMLNR
jgi:hypothetical protein